MSHRSRNSEQTAKYKTLLAAVDGDGEALDTVVGSAYGSDYVFHNMPDSVSTNSAEFVELYSVELEFVGGKYTLDALTFFKLDGAGTPNQDFGVLRYELDDSTIEIEFRRTRTANEEDEFELSFFDEFDLTPGAHKFSIFGRVDTEADELLTVDIFRLRIVKVAEA